MKSMLKLSFAFYYCLLVLIIVTGYAQPAQAQYRVGGKVVVDETGGPLAGASIYINGSTVGTTANENGDFLLPPVKNGYYEIVASFVGYEIIVYRATIQSKDLLVTFRMKAKPAELRDVIVLTKEGRAKWLSIFRENFLGITEAAGRTTIKNEDEILFAEGGGKRAIKAFSTIPLEIINKELGYHIFFELVEFYYDGSAGRTYFYGYSRFEELKEIDKVPGKYLRNRERYYRGSTLHFFHSLIDNRVQEEGFLLLNIRSSDGGDSSKRDKEKPPAVSGKVDIGYPVMPGDIISKDSIGEKELYRLSWKDRLRVNYGRDPWGKAYLKRKVMLNGNLPLGVSSDIEMLESPAYMDPNGSLYNPLAIQVSGYWSYEKLANMLPINYRPSR